MEYSSLNTSSFVEAGRGNGREVNLERGEQSIQKYVEYPINVPPHKI
jgi:hypothetical protein